MNFGDRIRKLRIEKGLTQKELASLLNIAPGSIQRFEYGTVRPSLDSLVALADIFEVSLDYLIGRKDISYMPIISKNNKGKNMYGIIAKALDGKKVKVENISSSPDFMFDLIRKLSENNVSICHVTDVIEDSIYSSEHKK